MHFMHGMAVKTSRHSECRFEQMTTFFQVIFSQKIVLEAPALPVHIRGAEQGLESRGNGGGFEPSFPNDPAHP